MAKGNKTKLIFLLISLIIAIVCGIVAYNYWLVIPSLAENIIENDRSNTLQHREIKSEMISRDEKVIDIVTDMRIEQREIKTILLERVAAKL